MVPCQLVGAYHETEVQPSLVCRAQHVFAETRSPPRLRVEGSCFFVGVRAHYGKLILLSKGDRLVEEAICLGVLPVRSRPRALDQCVGRGIVLGCASRPLPVQRQSAANEACRRGILWCGVDHAEGAEHVNEL